MKFFNPYQSFVGSFIPNCLMKYPHLSPSAKLLWARLAQYAGKNGYCYPSVETLADELGISKQQIIRLLKELETKQFIYRDLPKGKDKLLHRTTKYYFIMHQIFEHDVNVTTGGEVNVTSGSNMYVTSGSNMDVTSITVRRESVERESKENNVIYSMSDKNPDMDSNPPSSLSTKEEKKEKKGRGRAQLADDEFLARIKELFPYIDIDQELRKMKAWLLTPKGRNRRLTRGFVVNWLSKIDKPLEVPQDDREPTDWIERRLWKIRKIREREEREKLAQTKENSNVST